MIRNWMIIGLFKFPVKNLVYMKDILEFSDQKVQLE